MDCFIDNHMILEFHLLDYEIDSLSWQHWSESELPIEIFTYELSVLLIVLQFENNGDPAR